MQLHYNSSSLATILSVKDVAAIPGVFITMDTREEQSMLVHYNSDIFRFKQCKDGLYFYDTADNYNSSTVTDYSLLQSVNDNRKFYTRQEIKGADDARHL